MENYEKVTKIGKGACGIVYLVRELKTKKLFAQKQIQLDEGRKNRTKEAVLREARILAELKHPFIVAYHDSFFDSREDMLLIIQDYCDGGTLDEKVSEAAKKESAFEEKLLMRWFVQLTMAIQYMHSRKILHRDLKTQNVFLNRSGTTCKLGDFGISKMLDQTVDMASTCVGTPCYLAPEMCQDIPYSSKADIWALGCLLYEIVALRPAFDANNLISLFYKIVKAESGPIPSHYSEDLQDLVTALLVKTPEDRPSARQILCEPYVSCALASLLKEKEYLRQARDSQATRATPPQLPKSTKVESPADSLSSEPTNHSVGLRDSGFALETSPSPTSRQDINSPQPSRSPLRVTTCQFCGKKFRMKSWLRKHIIQHHQVFESVTKLDSSPKAAGSDYSSDEETDKKVKDIPGNHGDRGLQVEEYEDDFEDENVSSASDDISEDLAASDGSSTDELEEEDALLESQYLEDRFEEYCSDEDLDDIVSCMRQIQEERYQPAAAVAVQEETVVDEEGPPEFMANCKNLLQQQCEAALGKKRDRCKSALSSSRYETEVSTQRRSSLTETYYLIEELHFRENKENKS